jgi:hemerythrin-like domain-containing protein
VHGVSVERSEGDRLIAWNRELTAAHDRLRRALVVAREALAAGRVESARNDLLLYCHGFCVALQGHHTGEDTALFPELVARHPELRATVAKLEQDHAMIAGLLVGLDAAVTSGDPVERVSGHLEGLAAIMESHFRFEERELLDVLETLDLEAEPSAIFGPL